jgi:hypothetical protein
LVWAFSELLVEPMKGGNIFEFYRREAEALAARGRWKPSILRHCSIESGSSRQPDREPNDINGVLAAVTGIGASNETEGMLATQMVATHAASITTLRRLKDSQTLLERDRYGSLAVKLLRAFAAQVEALQRYRGKGQQKVTVEHVHVNAGGQAIVGAVTPGGGGKEQSAEQAHAPSEITHEPGTPMWSQDPEREAVPVPGGARKAPV